MIMVWTTKINEALCYQCFRGAQAYNLCILAVRKVLSQGVKNLLDFFIGSNQILARLHTPHMPST